MKAGDQNHRQQDPYSQGPGTELKIILRRFGINPKGNCKCNQRAKDMDSNGVEWCERHLEEIVDWLEEEAKNRHLPFLRAAGRVMVRQAIRRARKKQKAVEHLP